MLGLGLGGLVVQIGLVHPVYLISFRFQLDVIESQPIDRPLGLEVNYLWASQNACRSRGIDKARLVIWLVAQEAVLLMVPAIR